MSKQRHLTSQNANQEEKLFEPRSILDNIDRGFIAVDKNWCIVYVNAKAASDVKQQVNQLIGKNLWETFPQLKGTHIEKNLRKVMKGKVALEKEDYSVLTGLWNQQKVYPTDNGIVIAWADITKRKEAELALKKSEEKFRVVAEATKMMVYEIDLITGKVYFYRGLEQLTGFKTNENEITVSWVLNRIHPNDKKKILKAIDEVNSGKRNNYNVRYRFMRGDGKFITVQDTAIITQDSNGKPISSIGGIIDVTEIEESQKLIKLYSKKLERLVEERTKELQDSKHLASVGLTAGMVGHDMRNPLQAIIGDLFLLKLEFNSLPEEVTRQSMLESLESIERNVEYINKIVQDLLDYTRPIKLMIEILNLETLIKEILKEIPINIDANYKLDTKAHEISTDPALLKRIITNLVNNSIQAMPNGGKLAINAFLKNDHVIIIIEDTGVGIPDEIKPKIFTPLFTTKAKGQGFGLAAVKRLVETLGGNIYFESEESKGTKFTIELPIKK